MSQILHGCVTTTEAVRREIQKSGADTGSLARKYGVSRTKVRKWRARDFVHDAAMGPKNPRPTALSPPEEGLCAGFRNRTLLPPDDRLYRLQEFIPHLSRSTQHRCLQSHNAGRLPVGGGEEAGKRKFADYPIGCFHPDIAELRTGEGRLQLFVAVDRTSKFAFAGLHGKKTNPIAAGFLRNLIAGVSCKIHTILTDNGVQFTNRRRDRRGAAAHVFDAICAGHGIGHRLTRVNHPWTNGQVGRMNRTLREATVKRYHYSTDEQIREHLGKFPTAYNFARRPRTLRGRTPYEEIVKWWKKEPERFTIAPGNLTLGLNT